MRSYTGCVTCRQRKLKCDEIKPICGHCEKSSRACIFTERVIFRSFEGYTEGKDKSNGPFEESQVWVEIPTELTFVYIDDPFELDSLAVLHQQLAQDDKGNTAQSQQNDHVHHNHGQDKDDPPIVSSPTNQDESPSTVDGPDTRAHESLLASHLLRHFREGPGQWMDTFDTGAYFSHKVPVMASTNPLLKFAACALSAKHLGHCKHSLGDCSGEPLYQGPRDKDVDWKYESAKYYDRAIGHLRAAVHLGAFETDDSNKEELFASIAILCTYELMDAPGTAWKAHLSALPLFSPGPESAPEPGSPITIPRVAIIGPIFWSLARQDLLCAFISETHTRLDLKNIRLWQNAGLSTDEHGLLVPFSSFNIIADVEEDTRSNELVWLLGNIANFVTSGDALFTEHFALPPGQRPLVGVTQEKLLERWDLLTRELQRWRHSLPGSFAPSARISMTESRASPDTTHFEQIWYDVSICAATMQSYHMACILLLANQPQESTAIRSSVSARLQSYRQSEREALRHARDICGISLANLPDCVRVHSVQPLSVAAQVFTECRDLRVVLELLSGIERDLGWTTSHHMSRVADLLAKRRDDKEPEWIFA